MLLLWLARAAAACTYGYSYEEEVDEVLWPRLLGLMAPDEWVLLSLTWDSSPYDYDLLDDAGVAVPMRRQQLHSPAKIWAFVPTSPLIVGRTYFLRSAYEDLPILVQEGDGDPPDAPVLGSRGLGIDVLWACARMDEVTFHVCTDAPVLVAAASTTRPPASLQANLVYLGTDEWVNLAFELRAELGSVHTLWFGSLDARGVITWAEPDTFEMPSNKDEYRSVTAVGAGWEECPTSFVGWGDEECRGCRPPEVPGLVGGGGCASAPGAPARFGHLGSLLAALVAWRGRRSRLAWIA